jgi:hypothetical protein
MPRARGERPVNSPLWWFLLVATIVFIYFVAVAASTVDDCEDRGIPRKEWKWFPPEWECIR